MSDDFQICNVEMSALETASFIASHAVADAESYLRGSKTVEQTTISVNFLYCELLKTTFDAASLLIIDPVRLLVTALYHAVRTEGERNDRWREIVTAFISLVRQECKKLAVPA